MAVTNSPWISLCLRGLFVDLNRHPRQAIITTYPPTTGAKESMTSDSRYGESADQLPIDPAKQQRVDLICQRVAEGQTIRQIAVELGCSPGTVMHYVQEHPRFIEQYARARDTASDLFESDIVDAAMKCTPETASADRVKIDALKWVAARRSPKKYGDRVDHTSSDGSMSPKPTVIELVGPEE